MRDQRDTDLNDIRSSNRRIAAWSDLLLAGTCQKYFIWRLVKHVQLYSCSDVQLHAEPDFREHWLVWSKRSKRECDVSKRMQLVCSGGHVLDNYYLWGVWEWGWFGDL